MASLVCAVFYAMVKWLDYEPVNAGQHGEEIDTKNGKIRHDDRNEVR
jgi:hypothetical protein